MSCLTTSRSQAGRSRFTREVWAAKDGPQNEGNWGKKGQRQKGPCAFFALACVGGTEGPEAAPGLEGAGGAPDSQRKA